MQERVVAIFVESTMGQMGSEDVRSPGLSGCRPWQRGRIWRQGVPWRKLKRRVWRRSVQGQLLVTVRSRV